MTYHLLVSGGPSETRLGSRAAPRAAALALEARVPRAPWPAAAGDGPAGASLPEPVEMEMWMWLLEPVICSPEIPANSSASDASAALWLDPP